MHAKGDVLKLIEEASERSGRDFEEARKEAFLRLKEEASERNRRDIEKARNGACPQTDKGSKQMKQT